MVRQGNLLELDSECIVAENDRAHVSHVRKDCGLLPMVYHRIASDFRDIALSRSFT